MHDDRRPVAALDCGTNSTRLLIVGPDRRVLERRMQVTRLGEGVDASGRLAPAAIARTVAVLSDYHDLMERHGVGRARMAATSAARDAANADAFFDAAERATGTRPELLSGDEEGRLSFAGATAALPADWDRDAPVLVVDIGGGSTELVVGRPSDPESAAGISLDVGCVRLSERFLRGDPPRPDELRSARAHVDEALGHARASLPDLPGPGPVIGLAGTVSTLASLARRLERYDRSRIHHARLRRDEVAGWLQRLAGEPTARRLERPGMDPGRADVIVGGVLVLDAVMTDFDRDTVLVSEDDILDGIAAGLLAA